MNATPILPADGPVSFPSLPTQRGGASRPGEPPRGAYAPDSLASMETIRGRTTPRGERLRVGDVLLGRYTVLAELGQGGMGVVYKCLDNVGGIEVALKCLPPELSRNTAEMEGIRENYAIVARLHHSAISGLRQLERDPVFDEYYLVMDLAEGEDLSQILRRRRGAPMPPQEAFAILRPLASALDYAHSEKVLHRDVKPANVKVDFQGGASRPGEPQVQLLDFGLAAEVRSSMSRISLHGHAGTSGTPAYMAPEQWEARPQSAATDQYALAVMAYQMLAGHLPFDADDTDVLRRAVLSRAPDPVSGLPRGANAALQCALAKDPAARFPSCDAFVAALSRGVQGGRLAGTARPTMRWIVAAVAVAVAGLAAMWFGRGRPPGGPSGVKESITEIAEPSGRGRPPGGPSGVEDTHAEGAEFAVPGAAVSTAPEIEEIRKQTEEERRLAETVRREAEAIRKSMEEQRRLEEERKAEQERIAREEAERKAAEEARLKAEQERIAREEAESKSSEEARRTAEQKRIALEEAERKAREEAERKAVEEARRKAEQERIAREEAERKVAEEKARASAEAERRAWEEAQAARQVRESQPARRPAAGESYTIWLADRRVSGATVPLSLRWVVDEAHEAGGYWMTPSPITQGQWLAIAAAPSNGFRNPGEANPANSLHLLDAKHWVQALERNPACKGWSFTPKLSNSSKYAIDSGSGRRHPDTTFHLIGTYSP